MRYEFVIIDRDDVRHLVEDPQGWESMKQSLKRSADKHGVMYLHNLETFTFHGKNNTVLRAEYAEYGIDGIAYLEINRICEDGTVFNSFTGKFDFNTYDEDLGEICAVTIGVEDSDDEQILTNLFESKVNLETTTSFDGTSLPAYDKLGYPLPMVSKAILVADESVQSADTLNLDWKEGLYDYSVTAGGTSGTDYGGFAIFVPGFDKQVTREVGGYEHPSTVAPVSADSWLFGTEGRWTDSGPTINPIDIMADLPDGAVLLPYDIMTGIGVSPLPQFASNQWRHFQYFMPDNISPIINYDSSLGNVFGTLNNFTLKFKYKADFNSYVYSGSPYVFGIASSGFYCGIRDANDNWRWLSDDPSVWANHRPSVSLPPGTILTTLNVDKDITVTGITLNPGDRIYLFHLMFYYKGTNPSDPTMTVKVYAGNTFKFSGLSKSASMSPKVFFINEVMSRVTEAITNDKIRVLSEYFGRTDSEPYAMDDNGCGGYRTITKGLFLRKMEQRMPSTPPTLNVSWQDIWNGINPIDNIGIGFEDDPYRDGYRVLRVESWRYFYKDDVVFSCIGVRNVKRRVRTGDYVTTFRIGYAKWESNSFSGIDEFLTKREYRTDVRNTRGTMEKMSQFVASGYAIEVTKRKGNLTTDDFVYDNDIFVIMAAYGFGTYFAENGSFSISSASNIIDPGSIYNWSIRPSQNMMRWAPFVFSSYKDYDSGSKLTFVDGSGNYYATGADNAVLCSLTDDTLSENTEITPALFTDSTFPRPIWLNEDIVYDFPISASDFAQIKANPTGLIYWEVNHTDGSIEHSGYGWIQELEYDEVSGMGKFTLKPKR